MSEEQDSWFKSAFGVDLDAAVGKIKEDVEAAAGAAAETASEVVQRVQEAAAAVTGGTTVAKEAAAGGGAPSGAGAGDGTAGGGSFPIGGSVGRGGQNTPDDVRAVQGVLGISADGQCGPQTIGAIEAFQRNMGMTNPDGRVDPGGATERALSGGAKAADPPAAPAPTSEPAAPEGADEGGVLERLKKGAEAVVDDVAALGGKVKAGVEDVIEGAKRVGEEVIEGGKALVPQGPASSGAGASEELIGIVRAELAKQIEFQVSHKTGVIDELNDLDNFRATDPDPVPDVQDTFSDLSEREIFRRIRQAEGSIARLEKNRTAICRRARADARTATEDAKIKLRAVMIGAAVGAPVATGTVQFIVARIVRTAAGGAAAIALAASLASALIAQHQIYSSLLNTLKALVAKAKADLIPVNTQIAVETKTAGALRRAVPEPDIDDPAPQVPPVDRPSPSDGDFAP